MIGRPTPPPNKEDKLSRKVKGHLRRNKSERAIQVLEEAISESPGNWFPTYLLGWVFEQLRRYDEALESYRRAETLAPWNAQLRAVICEILLRVGDAGGALPYAEAIVEAWPSSSEARSLYGKALLGLQSQGEAESALLMAIQLSADNPDARAELVRLYEDTGREYMIRPLLEAYLKSAPNLASSHAFWARFQFRELGNCQEALPHYEKALLLYAETNRPGYFLQYFSTSGYPESIIYEYLDTLVDCGLGDAAQGVAASHLDRTEFEWFQAAYLERLVDAGQASALIEKVLKSEPQAYQWRHRLAGLRLIRGEFHEAEEEARGAVEAASAASDNDPWYQAALVVSLLRQGKEAEADALRRALSSSDLERLEIALTDQYARLKDWEQVISTSKELLRKNNTIAPVVMRLGEALAATGQYESAIENYLSLVDKQPDNPRFWLALAKAQIQVGDPGLAKTSLDHALRASPPSSSLRDEAGRLLRDLDAAGKQ